MNIYTKTDEDECTSEMLLFFLIALAALRISAHLVVRDIEPAEEQLADIANQLDNLLITVNKFPKSGGTSGQLLVGIHHESYNDGFINADLQNVITLFDDVAETTVNATTSVLVCYLSFCVKNKHFIITRGLHKNNRSG